MKKVKMTFEIDPVKLFDTIKLMNDDMTSIGERLIGTMLTGHASLSDQIGMAVYGIVITDESPIEERASATPSAQQGTQEA